MSAGLLRTRIDILAPSRDDDGAGGGALVWTVAETLWAELAQLPGAVVSAGEQRRVRRRWRARVRGRDILAPGLRARIEGVSYEIAGVEADRVKPRFMTLLCEEVSP